LRFHYGGDVVIPMRGLPLAGGQVTIDEADGGVIEYEADDEGTFVTVYAAHAEFDLGGIHIADLGAFGGFYEYTGKETNEIGGVKKHV